MTRDNFGKNISLHYRSIHQPQSEAELLALLDKFQNRRVRMVGRLHSWSRVVETDDILIDLRFLDSVEVRSDGHQAFVDVGAGCQVKRLLSQLSQAHLTLPAVGLITEQSIVGAISTGTHGSGKHSLSHYVAAIRVAVFDPSQGRFVVQEYASGDERRALRCGLGCLGAILSVTLEVRNAYQVEEHWHEYECLEDVLAKEVEFPLQQFFVIPWRWTFFAQHRREHQSQASWRGFLYRWYRFLVIDLALHLVLLLALRVSPAGNLIPVIYRRVLPYFVLRDRPVVAESTQQLVMAHHLFRHVEIELFVPRSQLAEALRFLTTTLRNAAGESNPVSDLDSTPQHLLGTYRHHYPICIRRIQVDDTLVSMASPPKRITSATASSAVARSVTDSARDSDWFSVSLISYHRPKDRQPFLRLAEYLASEFAERFQGRPHWGKICPLPAGSLKALYPNWPTFCQIARKFDAEGRFRNSWMDELLEQQGNEDTSEV